MVTQIWRRVRLPALALFLLAVIVYAATYLYQHHCTCYNAGEPESGNEWWWVCKLFRSPEATIGAGVLICNMVLFLYVGAQVEQGRQANRLARQAIDMEENRERGRLLLVSVDVESGNFMYEITFKNIGERAVVIRTFADAFMPPKPDPTTPSADMDMVYDALAVVILPNATGTVETTIPFYGFLTDEEQSMYAFRSECEISYETGNRKWAYHCAWEFIPRADGAFPRHSNAIEFERDITGAKYPTTSFGRRDPRQA